MLCCTLEETVAPVSKPFSSRGDVLGPCSVSGSLESQRSYSRGKPRAHSSAQWSPAPDARRCCGPGASSEDEDEAVQEYLKEEDYS